MNFQTPCSSRGKGRLGTTERVIVISPGAVKLKHQDVPRDCASRTDSEDLKICLVFLWSLFSNNLASTTTNHLQQVFQLGHRWFEVHFHILASVSRWGKENALPPDDSKPLLSLSLSQIRCRTFCKPRLIQNSLNLEEWRWLCFGITLCGLHGQRPFASITVIGRLRRIEEIIRDH